jgi:hypothetical protein
MGNLPYHNGATRLFLLEENKQPLYTDWSIYRVMWKGKKKRVIVYGLLPHCKDLLHFKDGNTLQVTFGHGMDLSEYDKENVIMTFQGCTVKNKWLPRMIATNFNELDEIRVYVELECEDIIMGI